MATQIKHRRGSSAEIAAFTPAVGEFIFNTTDNSIHTGDGVTQGGHKIPNSLLNINDTTKKHTFGTLSLMSSSLTAFPVGKVLDTTVHNTTSNAGGASYVVTAGASPDAGSPALTAGLYAKFIKKGQVNPQCMGAIGDDSTDDTAEIILADSYGKVRITERYLVTGNITFTNKVVFNGGAIRPSAIGVELNLPFNDKINGLNFGAIPDATIATEVVSGTDNYIPLQVALLTCARTNGKKTFVLGGGDFRIDTGLVNTIAGTGSCSMLGKGLLGARFLTDKDITGLHLGGSAQTIKRFYVLYANPTAALTGQVGVRFASDDFQWSQSTIEQVWVQNPHVGFYQANQAGTFGTIFLNTYRNCQIINNREWGLNFDSKNGSTTIHLDTVYVKGNGTTAKGMRFRSIKDVITTNCAIDACVNEILDIAAVNLGNHKNFAIESCLINDPTKVMCSLNATTNHIDGFTSTVTTIDVGAAQNARVLFFGGNSTASSTVKGYVEIGTIITSGNKFKAAIGSNVRVNVLDDSIKLSETTDNGFAFGFSIKGQDFSRNGNSPSGSGLTGDRERGHVFWNGAAAVGQPKFWVNTTGGASSTYVSGGVL